MKRKQIHRAPGVWQQLIQDQEQSALNIKDFCRENQISTSGFYKWRAQFNSEARDKISKSTGFIPVKLETESAPTRQNHRDNLMVDISLGQWFKLSWQRSC